MKQTNYINPASITVNHHNGAFSFYTFGQVITVGICLLTSVLINSIWLSTVWLLLTLPLSVIIAFVIIGISFWGKAYIAHRSKLFQMTK